MAKLGNFLFLLATLSNGILNALVFFHVLDLVK